MNTHKAKETSHVAQDDFRPFDRGRAERGDLGPDLRIRGRRRLARWWLSWWRPWLRYRHRDRPRNSRRRGLRQQLHGATGVQHAGRAGGALGQRLLLSRSLSRVRNGNPGLARGRGVFMQVRSIIPWIIRDCLHTTGSTAAYLRTLTTL